MKVLYDPSYSEKGVLQAAARVPRAANPLDFEVSTFEGRISRCFKYKRAASSTRCRHEVHVALLGLCLSALPGSLCCSCMPAGAAARQPGRCIKTRAGREMPLCCGEMSRAPGFK